MRNYLIAVSLIVTLGGCAMNDPNAYFSAVRVEPMGKNGYMISCVDSPSYCAEQANNVCPGGFDVQSNVTNPADYGRMTMIIKCTK